MSGPQPDPGSLHMAADTRPSETRLEARVENEGTQLDRALTRPIFDTR